MPVEKGHVFTHSFDLNQTTGPIDYGYAFLLDCVLSMPNIVLKGKNNQKMARSKKILLFIAAILVLSCLSKKQDSLIDLATTLALKEELTETAEAIVWMRGPFGNLSSHWIMNDAFGVIVVASRTDGVVPMGEALWRFPAEDTLADYDWLVLHDLVSGETLEIPLDDDIADDEPETADAGVLDSGVDAPDDEPDNESSKEMEKRRDGCDIRSIQALPVLLGAVGPYLFAEYNEKQYDCKDMLLISRDRYIAVDLEKQEVAHILTTDELETLMKTKEVRDLEREGTVFYVGSSPLYNGKVEPVLSHVFATKSTFLQDNGSYHAVVNSLEILGQQFPRAIMPYVNAPELVQVFAAMFPTAMPAGWWPIAAVPHIAKKQLEAFGVRVE
jgi:hypothetical protein